jgi:putative flippase GtrA
LKHRITRFYAVGLLGIPVQLGALALLSRVMDAGPATALSVEIAIIHNFLWHRRWTWSDRRGSFWQFNATTGLISILGNTFLTVALVRMGVTVVAANAVAIAICSAATYLAASRVAFRAVMAGPDTLPDKHQCAACSPSSLLSR